MTEQDEREEFFNHICGTPRIRTNLLVDRVADFYPHAWRAWMARSNLTNDTEALKTILVTLERISMHGILGMHNGGAVWMLPVRLDKDSKDAMSVLNEIILRDVPICVQPQEISLNSI